MVLSGVNVDVADGEFVVIVGPSGCGKSTLLRMVAGLERVTSGEIRIDGRVVNDLEPKDRDIAMVFQNYALYPHMSVYDNMAYGLRIRGMDKSEIRTRVEKAAEILELSGLLARKPRELSGGQRQRVAMGRAIVRVPKVFLFDEPLSNLDAKLRVQMRAEIRQLHERLRATTLFVADFIGSPPMNLLPGRLAPDGETFAVDAGPALPLAQRPAARAGTELMLGIRPEDLRPHDVAANGSLARVELVVEYCERLGAENLAYGHWGPHQLVARLPHGTLPAGGERLYLEADPKLFHLFDPAGGKRIDA